MAVFPFFSPKTIVSLCRTEHINPLANDTVVCACAEERKRGPPQEYGYSYQKYQKSASFCCISSHCQPLAAESRQEDKVFSALSVSESREPRAKRPKRHVHVILFFSIDFFRRCHCRCCCCCFCCCAL